MSDPLTLILVTNRLVLDTGSKRETDCAIDRIVMQIEEPNEEMSSTRWLHDTLTPLRKKIGVTTRSTSEIPSAEKCHWYNSGRM